MGQEYPLEKEIAIHSSILAWRIPWTNGSGTYKPWDHKEWDMTKVIYHTYSIHAIFFLFFLLCRYILIWVLPSPHETIQQNNSVMEFILLGLTQDPKRQKMVFVIFIFYVGILMGNFLIIMTVKFSRTPGSPMYFFLFYLSLVDTCFSTSVAPRLIVDALFAKKSIFYNECLTQVLHCIYMDAWRSLSWSSWPWIGMWLSVSPWIMQPSWAGKSASSWLFLYG